MNVINLNLYKNLDEETISLVKIAMASNISKEDFRDFLKLKKNEVLETRSSIKK
ncbi:anti-repressor SinI family protein [Ammoniphilus oxalaticus]|uniref:anti-repressor SinI family protein n=1 Tax=Ammoniphilus oxalaticus TaxID=66863 RepID=UPI001FE425A3|nr:anti-repressor SinI family protein [Ammoniphilus oxalaticus]